MERLEKLLERLDYTVVQGSMDIEITELVYDSRKVTPGCLFVCIKGTAVDGHTFVQEVAAHGAAAILVQDDVEAPENVTVVKVKDSRYGLALLLSRRKVKGYRRHRNEGKDHDHIHGEIHSGKCRL